MDVVSEYICIRKDAWSCSSRRAGQNAGEYDLLTGRVGRSPSFSKSSSNVTHRSEELELVFDVSGSVRLVQTEKRYTGTFEQH